MKNEHTKEGCPTFEGRGGGGLFMGIGLALMAYGCVHVYLVIEASLIVALLGSLPFFLLGTFFLFEGTRKWRMA